jgi:hypothetical protein
MIHTRRYLVPSSFARLLRKEFGTQGRVLEGYFSSTPERSHLVRIDPPACTLVIVLRDQDGAASEEVTAVPYSQPPVWVGPDVSGDPSFDKATIALQGAPEVGEPEISNAALEALLDLLEGGLYAQSALPIATDSSAAHEPQHITSDWLARAWNPADAEHPQAGNEVVRATSHWAPVRIRRAAG